MTAHPRVVVALLAAAACALSALYVAHYLRGGPRIIDATSYYLEARALASGHVAFPVPSPSGSFRGRFLVALGANASTTELGVVFPPGYPAFLAVFFRLGAPLASGPVLAALLVVITAALALRVSKDVPTALLAALFSTVCAVLRYHTADTMSHGLAALLLATCLWATLGHTLRSYVLAGFCAGALCAVRPASGVVAGLLLFRGIFLSVRRAHSPSVASRPSRLLAAAALGAALPLFLFVWQQRTLSGTWFGSTQYAYYEAADGPPGCFRYGFGSGIGCLFEHGDFVRARLAKRLWPRSLRLLTTARRLKMHLADAANLELFAPLVLCAAWRALREPSSRLVALGFVGIVLAYVPFYFDGNYPGGGARFFADALPLEHVLLAAFFVRVRLAPLVLPLSLAGFALHTNYDHLALARREGGRPMYEPSVVASAGVTRGLVFVDTDHGFDLGHDPGMLDASRGVVVARLRRDAHDVALWDALGRPPAYDYVFASRGDEGSAAPRLEPWNAGLASRALDAKAPLRFEAEAEWPPLAVTGGSAYPDFPACASGQRALGLHPVPGRGVQVTVATSVPRPGHYQVRLGWFSGAAGCTARVTLAGRQWTLQVPAGPATCSSHAGPTLLFENTSEFMHLAISGGCSLDFVELLPDP